jgi:hypothetical protein
VEPKYGDHQNYSPYDAEPEPEAPEAEAEHERTPEETAQAVEDTLQEIDQLLRPVDPEPDPNGILPADPDSIGPDGSLALAARLLSRLGRGTTRTGPAFGASFGPGGYYGPDGAALRASQPRATAPAVRLPGLADEPSRELAKADASVARKIRQMPGPGRDPLRGALLQVISTALGSRLARRS